MIRHWGGPPYPLCECGHDRLAHRGQYGTDNLATSVFELGRRRLGRCAATKGTDWCKCSQFAADQGVAA